MSYTPINSSDTEMHVLEGYYTPTPKPDFDEVPDTSSCSRFKRNKLRFYVVVWGFIFATVFFFTLSLVQMINDVDVHKHENDPNHRPIFPYIGWLSFIPYPLRCIAFVLWMLGSVLVAGGLLITVCCCGEVVDDEINKSLLTHDAASGSSPKTGYQTSNV